MPLIMHLKIPLVFSNNRIFPVIIDIVGLHARVAKLVTFFKFFFFTYFEVTLTVLRNRESLIVPSFTSKGK